MVSWFDRLLALLAEQPRTTTTVTLSLADLDALASGPLPAGTATQSYWWGHAVRRRLAAIGWCVASVSRRSRTVTFTRIDPSAATPGSKGA